MYCHIHRCQLHHCKCGSNYPTGQGGAFDETKFVELTQEFKEELKKYTVLLKDEIINHSAGIDYDRLNEKIGDLELRDLKIVGDLNDRINTTVELSDLKHEQQDAEIQVAKDMVNALPFEDGALDDTFVTATAKFGGVERTQADKNADFINVKDFGAKCDGVTDDTIALQKYLNTDITNIVIPGSCLVSGTLTSTLADRIITTTGYGFIGGAKDLELLRIEGVNTTVRVNIDGKKLISTGIRVLADKAKILGCDINGIYGEDKAAFGIMVDGDVSATIGQCTVNDVDALPDNNTASAAGAARAIYVTSAVKRIKPVLIIGNTLTDVKGTEGNAIHVICSDGTFPFLDSNAVITDNTIVNCSRRAIKIQASNTVCIGNTHINTLTIDKLPTATSLINAISCNNVIIKHNTLDARVGFSGIVAAGQLGEINTGNIISNNTIKCGIELASGDRPSQIAIYINYNKGITVDNNTIDGGYYSIGIDNTTNSTITNNICMNGKSGSSSITLSSNSNANNISNNKLLFGSRSFFIQNAGQHNYVSNNTVISGGSGCVVPIAGAIGSLYENNSCMGTGTAVFIKDVPAGEGQIFNNHRSMGGASSSPSVMFTKESPETELPNINHSRGDISYKSNPVAGGIVGWICIGSGMWRSFGSISATP